MMNIREYDFIPALYGVLAFLFAVFFLCVMAFAPNTCSYAAKSLYGSKEITPEMLASVPECRIERQP